MNKSAGLLLIEDNEDDYLFIRRAFEKAKIANELVRFETGSEGLAYLRKEPPHQDASRPDLVLLDLNLPGMSGFDVLGEIRSDPELQRLIVVVLTTSTADEDVVRSYDLFANAFIKKPGGTDEYIAVLRTLNQFWFEIVVRPPS